MRVGKLRSGLFLLYCFLTGSLRGIFRQLPRGPFAVCRELFRFGVRSTQVVKQCLLILWGGRDSDKLVWLCQEVQTDPQRLYRNPDCALFLVQPLLEKQQFEKVIEIVNPLVEPKPDRAKSYGVRGVAYMNLGHYKQALADLTRCHELMPHVSIGRGFNHQRAFLHSLRGDVEGTRAALRDQCALSAAERSGEELARFLHKRLKPLLKNLDLRGSVGIFLGSYWNALGHSILDPFHFINLFGQRFDNLIMVHPDLSGYTPATRLTVSILEQYVETVLCTDPEVLSFAWQNLGELQYGNCTFLLYNYWLLNRLAFQSRQNPAHPLHHGREYFRPSRKIVARAEVILKRNHVDLSGPLVIVHLREHGYHKLRGQSYRNTEVRNYIPALRKLISLGYRVVRIGDRKMTSLRRDVPGLVELPLTDYYSSVLDPYLIARCEFMISCQSGPCSYARVLGKPNLVVNAVYDHSLIPEQRELIAFKDYRNAQTKESLSVEQVCQMGAHLFDRTQHFIDHGIELVDMTPDEIEAAVCEMLEWVEEPDLPETAAQREFRRLMIHYGTNNNPDTPFATPISDYIGYALPECRISDAVASMRPGYLNLEEPGVFPAAPPLARIA